MRRKPQGDQTMPGEGKPLIRSTLESGDVAIDIGANPKGDDVVGLMCECVKSDGLVLAFDPFPIEGFHALETEYENLVCIPEAVASERVSIEETQTNIGSSTEEHLDRTYEGGIPLDIVAYADFVKVDVEGYEYDVLRSGIRLLSRHQPTLLIEVHKWKEKGTGWTRSLMSLLQNLGYDLYSIDKETNVTSADELQDAGPEKLFCTPQVRNQEALIQEREWDWLLILDACRYDAFEAVYETYLDGELQEVRSPASQIVEWLSKTWPETYDVTYVSALPIINSDGIRGNEPMREEVEGVEGANPEYLPADHFAEIVDVWDSGYDETIETVHPEAVNEAVRTAEPPCVGHYSQPNFPWSRGMQWADKRDVEIPDEPRVDIAPEGSTPEPRFSQQRVKSHFGEEGVKYAYKDNLEFVLEHVSNVAADLHGTVVITADYGKVMTGQDVNSAGQDDDILRVVPWLEVSNTLP